MQRTGHRSQCGLLRVVWVYLAGAYLFGHFSLSHTFMPVVEEGDQPSWVRFAMEHSVDISPGNRMVDWVMVRKGCYLHHAVDVDVLHWALKAHRVRCICSSTPRRCRTCCVWVASW
jgi:hypothetical protein